MRRAFEQPTIGGLPLYDQKNDPPQWFGTALSSFGIVYNRDVLQHLELPEPRTWSDLRDPRYRGWIVLADPTAQRRGADVVHGRSSSARCRTRSTPAAARTRAGRAGWA